MSLVSWKESIPNAIERILEDNPDENRAVVLNALYDLKDRLSIPDLPAQIDYVPNSRIDEMMQESLFHFKAYMENKSLEQIHRSEHHGSIACDELRRMLSVNEQIALDLYHSADMEEKEHIKQSYKSIVQKL